MTFMNKDIIAWLPRHGLYRPEHGPAAVRGRGARGWVRISEALKDGQEILPETPCEKFHQYNNKSDQPLSSVGRDVTAIGHVDVSQRWMAKIVESSGDAVIGKTLQGIIVCWNQAAERLYGYAAAEVMGRPVSILFPPDCADEVPQMLERIGRGEHIEKYETERIRKNGKRISVSLTVSPIRNAAGVIIGAATISRDITLRVHNEAEELIHYLTQHDTLTGLPNRALFRERATRAIARARRNRHPMAVLFIDLDHFKDVNDSFGHQIGDHVLRVTAKRLQRCLREDDGVARLGGDEFVVSLPILTNSNDATSIARKILETLREPFRVDQREVNVSGSIGISLYPGDGRDVEALIHAADIAMYHAKKKGRNTCQLFTPRLNEVARHRAVMADRLHQALQQDEFVLHYQPQVDLKSGTIISAEALLRWRQPDASLVPAEKFIKVAEETGLIVPLGEWMMRHACEQLTHWRRAGHPDLRIAVNLSARQFRHPGLPDLAADVLREAGLPGAALEMEIAEDALASRSPEETVAVPEQLAGTGIRLALDRFGTGCSSLTNLHRFPVHALKIDRSLVDRIGHEPDDTALVSSIIAMAESLQLKVIAVGVETGEQAAFLKTRGCFGAQGLHYGGPVSAEVFGDLLKTGSALALAS